MLQSMWSNYAGNRALAHCIGHQKWLAFHKDDPGDGDTATEFAGNGYERKQITWSTPSGKATANTSTPVFTMQPADLITWLALWDRHDGGNMIAKQRLDDPIPVPEDGQVRMAKGDIAWVV